MSQKAEFKDFIVTVPEENQDFVRKLHEKLMERGCRIDISYSFDKKTAANYVFRKKAMLVRIYGAHVNQYTEVLDTFPEEMVQAVLSAPPCKRMKDPDSCNPRCSMGYDFWLKGEHCQMPQQRFYVFDLPAEPHLYRKAASE